MATIHQDERIRQGSFLGRLLSRPELGAVAGTLRTQVSGIHELAANDPLNRLFSGQVFSSLIAYLSDLGLIAKRADGLPSITGVPVSIIWWIVLTLACTWLLTRTRFGNWTFAA